MATLKELQVSMTSGLKFFIRYTCTWKNSLIKDLFFEAQTLCTSAETASLPWILVEAASCWCFSAAGPGGLVRVGVKCMQQNSKKFWRKTCCDLQENCNLGDNFFFCKTSILNMKPQLHRNDWKTTKLMSWEWRSQSPDLIQSRICGRFLEITDSCPMWN